MTPVNIAAAPSVAFNGVVAHLFDTNLSSSPSDFNNPPGSVTINWGDGQTSSGTVVGPVLLPGTFQVDGTHTYVQSGDYRATIMVANSAGNDASATSAVTVGAQAFPVTVNSISAVAGAVLPADQVVASFITPSPLTAGSTPSALINWGDGQTSYGTITGGPQAYNVTAGHTYTTAGSFTTSVIVVLPSGLTSTGYGQAAITANLPYAGINLPIVVPVSQLFSGPVATFTDSSAADPASIFTASIAWGDGGTTEGTVTGSDGSFQVNGLYTYSAAGTYAVTVTISDQSGNTFTITDSAQVVTTDLSATATFLTGGLAAISSNGPNASSGYTDTNRPTFSGTTVPFAVVDLYARISTVDATMLLGQAVANASGQWTLTTGPLADGIFTLSATVTPPAGYPATNLPLTSNDQIIVDTVSPQVMGATELKPGRYVVSFRDDLSGMEESSLLNANNYTFAGPGVTALHPTSVSPLASGNLPTDAQRVLLKIKATPRALKAIRALRISGTNLATAAASGAANEGIVDNAGNPVDGNFHLSASPASGRAAGNYVVKFRAKSRHK